MRYLRYACAAFIALIPLAQPAAAADFYPLSWSIGSDAQQKIFDFNITFNRQPDFYSVDNTFRQFDAFQFYIDATKLTGAFDGASCDVACQSRKSVVRGSEIYLGNGLPIRRYDATYVSVPGDTSGGWGPVADLVPITLNGSSLSFSVSWAALADTDGILEYEFETFYEGRTTFASGFQRPLVSGKSYTYAPGEMSGVPESSTWLMMIAGVGFAGAALRRRRRHLNPQVVTPPFKQYTSPDQEGRRS